jgi:translation initiation factor eIF-2B subunit delta
LFPRLSQTSIDENESSVVVPNREVREVREVRETRGNVNERSKVMTKKERRELQELQRAEKAARLGQPQQHQSSSISKPKQKVKLSTSPPKVDQTYRPPTNKKQTKKQPMTGTITKTVALFSHLSQFDAEYNLQREKNAVGVVHPAIIALGVQYAESAIVGGNARCFALMLGLSKVISDYVTPSGTSLHRHLTQHISKQVDYISNSRPLAPSMKTAIRYIKNEIANLNSSLPDEDVFSIHLGQKETM